MLETLADRVWFAFHCLPRKFQGAPISFRALEIAYQLPNGAMQKVAMGLKKEPQRSTFRQLARALHVSEAWLEFGGDGGPKPTVIPPRPGEEWPLHRDLEGWDEAVEEAKADERQIIPPEAFRAGAVWPVTQPCGRVTPEIAIFVSGYAWEMAPAEMKKRYSTEEARASASVRRMRHGRTA
jgi:hypothetical protein